MKHSNSNIKTASVLLFGLIISAGAFSQTQDRFKGWSVSFQSGATITNSGLNWTAPLQVDHISNLVSRGTLFVVPSTSFSVPDTNVCKTSAAASLQIGYKKELGQLFVGIHAGVSTNPFKAMQTTTFYPETILQARNPLTISRTISSGLSKTLEVSFGINRGHHQLYATSGVVLNPVSISSSDNYQLSFQNKRAVGVTAAAPGTYNYTSISHEQKETHTLVGISWGLGYQYKLSEVLSLGLEYRATGFGKGSYTTEKVTGEQAVDPDGKNAGTPAGIGASNISVNMKQQMFSIKVDVALSSLFRK